jgi:hypothetical protein
MSDPTDLSALETLLQERDALHGWLDRLDRSQASVPEAVRAKVRQDYQSRLDGLLDRLRQHADVVATRLLEDQAEHDRLRDQARQVREALAEAELRHAVGEYDGARFEAERSRYVAALEEHESALDAVALRIAGLEDVHLAVLRDPEPNAPIREILSAPEFHVDQAQAEVFLAEEVTIEEPAPTEPPDAETDDLLSIFDQAERAEAQTIDETTSFPPIVHEREEPIAELRTHGFGPLSFTPKGGVPEVSGHGRPIVPSLTPPIGMPGLDQSPRFVRPAPERGSELVELPPERGERFRVVPDPEPILPEVAAVEATEVNARTLRCGECGAMNRPLEWYCEKCGAELTAV